MLDDDSAIGDRSRVKAVRYTRRAADALAKHRNRAEHILAKIGAYAADPASAANNVTALKGEPGFRLRIGDFRVIFEESETEIVVLDIGPRGGIYG